jgi:hypothetical protein
MRKMSNSAVHHIARFLMETRTNPSNLGYSASDFWSDVEDVIPKSTKKKARRAVKSAQSAVEAKLDATIDKGADKAFSYADKYTGYKEPSKDGSLTQTASEDALVDPAQIEADKKAAAEAEKQAKEAERKKYQMIALTSVATVGGLTVLYFILTRNK